MSATLDRPRSDGDAGSADPAAAPPPLRHVDRVVALARRRMRINRALAAGIRLALGAATVLLIWITITRVAPIPRPQATVLVIAGGVVVLGAVVAAVLRIPEQWAAWAADRWLRLPDTIATAVQLRATPPLEGLSALHLQRADAAAASVERLPGRPTVPTRLLGVAAAVALVAGGLAAFGDPQAPARRRVAQERAVTSAQADELREQADELREQADQPEARAAAERLERLADDLEGADLESALDELEQARAALEQRAGADLGARRTALAGLERAVGQQPLAGGGGGAAQQLGQLADDLDAGTVDAATQQELADRLEQLADALSAQPQVAQALGQAAQQLAAGNAGAAATGMRGAAGAATTAAQQVAGAEANAAAAGAAASAADALRSASAGQSASRSPGAAADGDGQGQGQGSGQGQGQQQGQGGGGGSGARASGQQNSGRGSGAGAAGSDAARTRAEGSLDDQTVLDPGRQASAGEDLQIQGQDSGDTPETTRGRAQGAGQRNDALVPFSDVLAEYAQEATQTVERPGYPVRLRDTVRDYFDGLAGGE